MDLIDIKVGTMQEEVCHVKDLLKNQAINEIRKMYTNFEYI